MDRQRLEESATSAISFAMDLWNRVEDLQGNLTGGIRAGG
jgi:hypothetical protein